MPQPEAAPYFSVITPSWNQGEWIEGCIKSVLEQGTEDFEHIVFDNCSTDGTAEVLARYPHLRTFVEPDHGQAHALNKALQQARGQVICWLNADDKYPPGTFDIVRRELSQPGVEVIYGDSEEVYFNGHASGVRKAKYSGQREDFLYWWQKRHDFMQPAVFFTRAAAERTGPLGEQFFIIMDTEYWWRMTEHYQFHYVPKVLAIQLRQPDSKTVKQVHRIYLEKQSFFEPLLHQRYPARKWWHILLRRKAMGWRWLSLARMVARAAQPELARECLRYSVRENPVMLLSPTWWRTRASVR